MRKVVIGASIANGKSYTINMIIKAHITELIGNKDEILIIDPFRELFHVRDSFINTEVCKTVKSRIKYMSGTIHTNFSTLISQCHEDILNNKFKYIFIDYVPITEAEKTLLRYYQNNTEHHRMMFVTKALPRNYEGN